MSLELLESLRSFTQSSTYKTGTLIGGIVTIITWWVLFEKAGEAGWQAIIPIWNLIVMVRIVYGSGAKLLFVFVPILNIIFAVLYSFRLADAYGKSWLFGLGLLFPPTSAILMLVLAFGKSEYFGPVDCFV